MTEQPATWVYAVVPAVAPAPVVPSGIAGEPVRLVEHGGIAAAVGSVDRAEVGEEQLPRHLRDPAWLERTARRHHRVVSTLAQALPTVPFRLATVYHQDSGVRQMLARTRQPLLTALDTVTSRAEWGVQVYASTARRPAPADPVGGAPAGPGTTYLLRQRAQRDQREQERRRIREAVRRIEASLDRLAVAGSAQPLTGAEPSSAAGSLVLNLSYLVDDRTRDEFVAATQRLADRFAGLRLRVTGPWPAYSFVEIEAAP
jgi:Gas vesicle synthesis protein GvpL/GvpF